MEELSPYSQEELQRMRRLIRAAGLDVAQWSARLRRSADWLQSLSPGQAAIVAQQATAIAADAADFGPEEAMVVELEELAVVPEDERATYIARRIIEIRRGHFPGPPDEE